MAYIKCLVLSGKIIPDGSTVLPTDDVQIWLHCANIWDKNYTTMSQVLMDSDTLLALMTTDNAVDYMIRSTTSFMYDICSDGDAMTYAGTSDYTAYAMLNDATWCDMVIGSPYFENVLNSKVPTMTSDNAPSGECLADSVYSSYSKYKAFDKNASTYWVSNVNSTSGGQYIGYKFDNNVTIVKLAMLVTSATTHNSKVQYSDDGLTWIDTGTTFTISSSDGTKSIAIINNGSHKYWRSYCISASANSRYGTYELQVYGRENGGVQSWLKAGNINKSYTTLAQVLADTTTLAALIASHDACDYLVTAKAFIDDIVANQTAMTLIGANNYCANTLLSDDDWCEAICNSTYSSSVVVSLVPNMTSATTPSGEVFANAYSSTYYPYKAFDGDDSTVANAWVWSGNGTNTAYIGYDFGRPVKIVKVRWRNRTSSQAIRPIKTLKVQASNDRVAWTDVSGDINGSNAVSAWSSGAFGNDSQKSQYRVFVTSMYDTVAVGIQELQFYGREDV